MRISTAMFHQSAIDTMLKQQAEVSKTQQQLASGQRIQNPSDDPVAAARLVGLKENLAQLQQYKGNADYAENTLQFQESLMAQVGDLLQNVRERVVQMANASQSNETRAAAAQEIRESIKQMLSIGNARDMNGNFVFAGSRSNTEPFAASAGTYTYQGDQSEQQAQISAGRRLSVSEAGDKLFMRIPEGNGTFVAKAASANTGTGTINTGSVQNSALWSAAMPDSFSIKFTSPTSYDIIRASDNTAIVAGASYTSGDTINMASLGVSVAIQGAPATGDQFTLQASGGASIFATLESLAQSLEKPIATATDQARYDNMINGTLNNLDQSLGNFSTARAGIGTRLQELDSVRTVGSAFTLEYQKIVSSLQDTDFAEAASRLSQQTLALQAAQKSYVQVQALSLFNFIN